MSNLEKMEKNVVDGYKKIEDGVVTGVNVEELMKNQNEMIKKSVEASMNAGKR